MEHIEGRTLHALLGEAKRKPEPRSNETSRSPAFAAVPEVAVPEVVFLVQRIASIIAAALDANVIHQATVLLDGLRIESW
jgi:hypothetical protein